MYGFIFEKKEDMNRYQEGKIYKKKDSQYINLHRYFESPLECISFCNQSEILCYYLIEIKGNVKHHMLFSETNIMKVIKELSIEELLEYCVDGETIYPSGKHIFHKNKQYHRDDDLPAIVRETNFNGEIVQEWWVDGKRHRNNGKPAVISSYQDDNNMEEWWIDGVLVKRIYNNNEYKEETFDNNKKLHSNDDKYAKYEKSPGEFYRGTYGDDDDPSGYDPDTYYYCWYFHGVLHRDDDKPAIIVHYKKYIEDNSYYHAANSCEWWYHGKKHRIGNPAIIHRAYNKIIKEWWENGILINKTTNFVHHI
jgi:hypothetical protein